MVRIHSRLPNLKECRLMRHFLCPQEIGMIVTLVVAEPVIGVMKSEIASTTA